MDSGKIKQGVKEAYTEVVRKKKSCCSSCGCDGEKDFFDSTLQEKYRNTEGWVEDADYALGCGLPTESSGIKKGDTVVDLGCGAGNDVFIARKITGESGRVIGVDMTEAMIEKARKNNERLKYSNVEFLHGDIEQLPLADNTADVVISNCVLNLVPDKRKAFSEVYRILKNGGHFSISDIVTEGNLPEKLKEAAAIYAACIGGAPEKQHYLDIIAGCGFSNVTIMEQHQYFADEDFLKEHLSVSEIDDLRASGVKILSITVNAVKI